MSKRTTTITEKDFEKYGIESHYDLDMLTDWSEKKGKKPKGTGKKPKGSRRRRSKETSKGVKVGKTKGVSAIQGEDTGRIIKGFASTTDKDRAKDVIVPAAMKEAVNDLVQKGANTVFLNHDTNVPIGRVMKTELKPKGIFVEIMISKASDVEDIWTKIKEGVLNAFSIRLKPKKVEVVEDTESGRIEEFRILSMELFEVSVVGLPMNAKAAITSVIEKSFKRSIRKYNKKTGSSKMRKGTKSKKKTRKKSGTRLTEARVKDMIEEANAPIMKGIEQLLADKAPKKKSKKTTTRRKAKAKSKKKSAEPTMADMFAEMQKTNAALVKGLNRRSRRKGGGEDNLDDDNGIPAKTLKDATDVDTVRYVKYAAEHDSVYKNLTEEEKRVVKGIYIQLMDAVQSVG
jgi:HK97 family phage prohead protease